MNCRDIERHITAYMDGELPPTERDAFFDHLKECSACCDLVGEASWTEATVAGVMKQHMEAPACIRYNVLSALSREAARPVAVPFWRRPVLRPATAMAALLALAGTGWRTFTGSLQPPTPVSETQTVRPVSQAKATPKPAAAVRRVASAAPATAVVPHVAPTARPAAVASKQPLHAAAPAPAAVSPAAKVSSRPDGPVGVVTFISTPGNVVNGRFLARANGQGSWLEAPSDLRLRTHLQSADETVVTVQLKDGTVVKANQRTEWVIQRSPTREAPGWTIRLVHGELWVRCGTAMRIDAPSAAIETTGGEFSVRSMDGEDATVLVSRGSVRCHNDLGDALVSTGQAGVTQAGESPQPAFDVEDVRGQIGWAYAPAGAFQPVDDNGIN